jgi:hypothetical protein
MRRLARRAHSGSILRVVVHKRSSTGGPVGTLMIVIGADVAGAAPFVVVVLAGGAGGGGAEVDEVPTYVLPGRWERVRNWV